MRCFLAVLGLSVLAGCSLGRKPDSGDLPSFRMAVVTDLKGYLEPCGCTSDPLGGIDHMAAEVGALRKDRVPLVFLVAGDAFFDAAPLDPARADQANRNAKTLVRILNQIGVTAVLPGPRDRAQPKEVLESLQRASEFAWLGMEEATVVSVPASLGEIVVLGVRPGADRETVQTAVAAARKSSDVAIALVDGSRRDANRVGATEGVDFIVHGGLDQDDALPPREAGRAWAFHASRQGQGLTVVEVYRKKKDGAFVDRSEWSRAEQAAQLDRQIEELASKIAAWEKQGEIEAADLEPQRQRLAALRQERKRLDAPTVEGADNAFFARFVELRKKSPSDEAVQKLMREHDKEVNEANRIAFADLKPPPLGPDDVAYVGSLSCSGCHPKPFAWWRNHSHGAAYLTLQQRHKEFNLDCVGCHVTGYQQPGGSTVTHNLDLALVGVGCESCHGPGAEHVADPEVEMVLKTPESTCVVCHNEEHSDLFDYETYMKQLIVPGHGVPDEGR